MLLGVALLALVQQPQPLRAGRTVTVVPGAEYSAGWLRGGFFGKNWRKLWVTPIAVPVANLDTMGGLTPFETGGSAQTQSLRFRTGDGRVYSFRSIDKSPSQSYSGILASPPVRWLAREQISGMFPAAALLVAELERAAGIADTRRWISVLPDSPSLGKWRDEFAGMLGFFERRFTSEEVDELGIPELPRAVDLISSDSLLVRLRRGDAGVVDQRRFLAARLFDFVIGDWDRHPAQWSWVGYDRRDGRWWVPLPKDRDWALSRFEGPAYKLARLMQPKWLDFGPRYGRLQGLTGGANGIDQRLLTSLERTTWDSIVASLRSRLSNAAIARAVAALPVEYSETLAEVTRDLQSRRDALPAVAEDFYRWVSQTVDIYGSDAPDRVEVTQDQDGTVLMELATNQRRVYQRRFVAEDTREIRLFLLDGTDTLQIRGAKNSAITLRLVPGEGNDVVIDSTGAENLYVYDVEDVKQFSRRGAKLRVQRLEPPSAAEQFSPPYRDWGSRIGVVPWFGVRPELGAILGAGPVFTTHGFGKVPYASRVRVRIGTTTKAGELNADLRGDVRFERPDRRIEVFAAALNADVIRYFGFGNETQRTEPSSFYNVIQQQYSLQPVVHLGFASNARLELGGLLRWSETDETRETLLAVDRPYGAGSFTEAGFSAAAVYDSRDDERVPSKGVTLRLTGRVFPAVLDVRNSFSTMSLVGTSYLTARDLPLRPTLALRIGAQRNLGSYPFFEAAHIGGRESLRGLTTRRYAGDAALYGNGEIRLRFGKGSFGLLGLADVGRVFLEDEPSGSWRVALGGGVWLAPPKGSHMLSAILAGSGERLRFYLHTGLHF